MIYHHQIVNLATLFTNNPDQLINFPFISSPDFVCALQLYPRTNSDRIAISFDSSIKKEARIANTDFSYQRIDWGSFETLFVMLLGMK